MLDDGHSADAANIEANTSMCTLEINDGIAGDPRALIDHILERYHAVHRRELPELCALARKVESTHAVHPDCPSGLANLLSLMLDDLEHHMMLEEQVLFPTLLAGGGGCAPFALRKMRLEHDDHQERLAELCALTTSFTPPSDACGSWRALYQGCDKLCRDLRRHIAIENDALFPLFEATR